MTRSLLFKLVLAFLIVSMTSAALVVIYVRWATFKEFDQLVLDRTLNDFMDQVTPYYLSNGSWDGVFQYMRSSRMLMLEQANSPPAEQLRPGGPQPDGSAGGQMPPQQGPQPGDQNFPPPFPPPGNLDQQPFRQIIYALVDQDGVVVIPAGPYRLGDTVVDDIMGEGTELEINGQVVGVVLTAGTPPPLDPREERFLERSNRALFYGALGGALIALLLGVIMARTLARPLGEMTAASRAIANGEFQQQVPVRSRDELGELAAAFNKMSTDLAHANELRRQMTADIAHDLRTPLTVISGYIESMREGVLKPSPERYEAIFNEVKQLQRLVEDLRTLSLVDAGELPVHYQLVQPQTLLTDVLTSFQHQAEQEEIELAVHADPDLPEIRVDPNRMLQVFGNLLSNALRYTPPGGKIALQAQRQGNKIRLIVQDNGMGILPEALPHIFDRFYRVDEARRQDDGETGLGLAIAKSIIEVHGGGIRAESEIGKGTRFIITLPSAA